MPKLYVALDNHHQIISQTVTPNYQMTLHTTLDYLQAHGQAPIDPANIDFGGETNFARQQQIIQNHYQDFIHTCGFKIKIMQVTPQSAAH